MEKRKRNYNILLILKGVLLQFSIRLFLRYLYVADWKVNMMNVHFILESYYIYKFRRSYGH